MLLMFQTCNLPAALFSKMTGYVDDMTKKFPLISCSKFVMYLNVIYLSFDVNKTESKFSPRS